MREGETEEEPAAAEAAAAGGETGKEARDAVRREPRWEAGEQPLSRWLSCTLQVGLPSSLL